jgi:hypothetical protein
MHVMFIVFFALEHRTALRIDAEEYYKGLRFRVSSWGEHLLVEVLRSGSSPQRWERILRPPPFPPRCPFLWPLLSGVAFYMWTFDMRFWAFFFVVSLILVPFISRKGGRMMWFSALFASFFGFVSPHWLPPQLKLLFRLRTVLLFYVSSTWEVDCGSLIKCLVKNLNAVKKFDLVMDQFKKVLQIRVRCR